MRSYFNVDPCSTGCWTLQISCTNSIYDNGYLPVTKDYDVDEDGWHSFITVFSLKAKHFLWGGDNTGILNIPGGPEAQVNGTYKYCLNSEGDFMLQQIRTYVETFINMDTRSVQDDAMVYTPALKFLSTEGQVKTYSWTEDFQGWSYAPQCYPRRI